MEIPGIMRVSWTMNKDGLSDLARAGPLPGECRSTAAEVRAGVIAVMHRGP